MFEINHLFSHSKIISCTVLELSIQSKLLLSHNQLEKYDFTLSILDTSNVSFIIISTSSLLASLMKVIVQLTCHAVLSWFNHLTTNHWTLLPVAIYASRIFSSGLPSFNLSTHLHHLQVFPYS